MYRFDALLSIMGEESALQGFIRLCVAPPGEVETTLDIRLGRMPVLEKVRVGPTRFPPRQHHVEGARVEVLL